MNSKTEKSRLDLFYEAARNFFLKVNTSHTQKFSDRMIKQLLDLAIAKYCDLSLSRKLIIQPLASANNESAPH